MENIKILIVGTLASLFAYLSPISGIIFSILYIFILNFISGYTAGMKAGEKFKWKKAFSTCKEVAIYYLILVSIFVIGEQMGHSEAALQAIMTITFVFIYFYAVNIIRNLIFIFSTSRGLKFLYFVLSLEVVKKIPYLEKFLHEEQKTQEANNEA